MPRIRSLKPDIWQNESFGSVSIEAMTMFVGLITQADDSGRQRGSITRLRATLFPYKPTLDTARVEKWLDELAARQLVCRYEVDGKPYIELPGWHEHQRIAHPSQSDIPAPPAHRMGAGGNGEICPPDVGANSADLHESSRGLMSPRTGIGKGEEETPMASGTLAAPARRLFEHWQQQCRHPHAKFTADRRRRLEARLREGYTEADIRQAIDGAARAAFVNDEGKRFDDLELICRNGSKLEQFMERATATPTAAGHTPSSLEIGAALAKATGAS